MFRESIKQLQENKKKYEHQIDYIVRDLIDKEKLDVELPVVLKRKSSYHNYRIKTVREKGGHGCNNE